MVQKISTGAAKALQQKSIGLAALLLRETEALINKKAETRRPVLIIKTPKVKKPRLIGPKIPVTPKNIKILNFYNFFYSAKVYKAKITLIIWNKLKAEIKQQKKIRVENSAF